MRRIVLAVALLAALALIPSALCVGPPLPPGAPAEWPEPEWHPMSLEDGRPKLRQIPLAGLGYQEWVSLDVHEGFYLFYRWAFIPAVAYDIETGEPVTPEMCLKDQTDSAKCRFTVTMEKDGEIVFLEPTSSFTGTGEWVVEWYKEETIFPRVVLHEYYIEYPSGLEQGTYVITIYGEPCNPTNGVYSEPWKRITTLYVGIEFP